MPPLSSLLAFSVSAAIIIVVPGPSVLFIVGRALSLGRRAALISVIGNSAGAFTQVVLVAVGLGAVLERSAAAYHTVKFVGAGYLVYLGVRTLRHRGGAGGANDPATPRDRSARLFRDGFVVGVANPKLIVFFAAILPQFVQHGGAPLALQMSVLGVVFVAIALVLDSTWALTAGTAREWFVRSPRRIERLTGAGGVMIAGLGVRLALTGREA